MTLERIVSELESLKRRIEGGLGIMHYVPKEIRHIFLLEIDRVLGVQR